MVLCIPNWQRTAKQLPAPRLHNQWPVVLRNCRGLHKHVLAHSNYEELHNQIPVNRKLTISCLRFRSTESCATRYLIQKLHNQSHALTETAKDCTNKSPPILTSWKACSHGNRALSISPSSYSPRHTLHTMQERQWGRRSCMQTQVHPPGQTLQHNARQVVSTQFMYASTSLPAWAHSAVKLKESHEYAVHVCKYRCTRQGRRCSTTQGKLWVRNSCMQTQVHPPGHILQLNWRKATSTQFMYANTGAPARADAAAQRKASCEYAIHVCKHRCTRQGRRCSTTQGKLWVRNSCMQTQVPNSKQGGGSLFGYQKTTPRSYLWNI